MDKRTVEKISLLNTELAEARCKPEERESHNVREQGHSAMGTGVFATMFARPELGNGQARPSSQIAPPLRIDIDAHLNVNSCS